jgi:hypothetical protein
MRVDKPGHETHDHGFGEVAHLPEHHDVGLGVDEGIAHDSTPHGPLDQISHHAETTALGGHVEIGNLEHDFDHGLHDGLDGLHDSVHHSLGLGFEADNHHSLHDGLHHEPHHDAHDAHQHDDLGGLFHH